MVTRSGSPTLAPTGPSQPASSSIRILAARHVSSIIQTISPQHLLDSQELVFKSYTQSHAQSRAQAQAESPYPPVQTPQRLALNSEKQTTLFMPSLVEGTGTAIKIVSIPRGGGEGLPASTVVMDQETGQVGALINARSLTALRNAAGSALFVRRFPPARPPRNLLIFGSGAQASAHATIMLTLFSSIVSCTIVVRRQSPRSSALLADLEAAFRTVHFSLGVASYPSAISDASEEFNLSQAVHNANIILTLTPATEPLFNSVDVTSGTRLVLVGSYKPHMREVDEQLIRRAGVVVVDSIEACEKEAGELQGLGTDKMVELGELLGEGEDSQAVVKRVEGSGDVVVFKSVGLGVQDVAIAGLVLREAVDRGIGTVIDNYD